MIYRILKTKEVVRKVSNWNFELGSKDNSRDWADFKKSDGKYVRLFRYQVEKIG